jgi:tetratricopeptide (TPR) repeat protein
MKSLLLSALVCSLAAGAVGAGIALSLGPRSAPVAQTRAVEPGASELSREVARLAASQAELAAALEELRQAPREPARLPSEDVGAAVERYLAARETAPGAEAAPAVDDDAQRVEEALARLLGGELDDDEVQVLWAELGKAGLSDELVAAFEARAQRDPNDPDVRVELGQAYLQKIFEVGNGPMAGVWAMKADAAFDAALALDERHWDARFTKAVSLSFWPPALGKQNAAIEQFELLLAQQQDEPKSPHFAQTYLFLGNMYQQTGQPEKALATWQAGLGQYPDNGELASQVQLTQKQP